MGFLFWLGIGFGVVLTFRLVPKAYQTNMGILAASQAASLLAIILMADYGASDRVMPGSVNPLGRFSLHALPFVAII